MQLKWLTKKDLLHLADAPDLFSKFMKCIIVDDEPQNRESLYLLLNNKFAGLEIVAQCGTCSEALAAINQHHPQLDYYAPFKSAYSASIMIAQQ